MLRVRVEKPDLSVPIDVRLVAQNAGIGMREWWADQLDAGEQPDGTPLPLNAKGKPLGRGRGTLIRRWVIRSASASRGVGRAWVQPYRAGKYRHATFQLAKRGLLFQTFAGESAKAWERISTQAATDALNSALERKAKRRRGRFRQWSGRPTE